ncbi:MAG TPA: MFS transporter [Longimicrobium sp.]|jgi:MFS family permease
MAERHDPYVSLRNPNFLWYVASLVALTLGTQIQATVVAWQVYEITRDPLSLGLVGLAEAIPFIGAALYAGHVADLHDRKRLCLAALLVQTACGGALLALAMRPQILAGGTWPIFAVVFASGIARSFLQPARTALGAEIVPRETYANAVAWRSSLWQFGAVMGPALGGVLYGFASARAAYAAEAALCALALLLFARIAYTRRPAAAREGTIGQNLTIGIRFLMKQPQLLGAQVLDLFSVLFGGAPALLPIFAAEILRVGPQGLGVLRAAPAAGAVAMSLVLAHRKLRRAGPTLLLCVAGFGVCWILFALSRSFWLSLGLLALSGMLDNVSVVIRSTLLTLRTPEHLLGRVSAVNQIFIGSSNEIGSFESGVAARLLGAVNSVLLGGLVTLGVVGVTAYKVPALRELDELE